MSVVAHTAHATKSWLILAPELLVPPRQLLTRMPTIDPSSATLTVAEYSAQLPVMLTLPVAY